MGFEAIPALISVGLAAYSMSQKRTPPKPGPAPTPSTGVEATATPKVRKYRPAAQMFRDEDLRLGAAGKLGL